MDFFTVTSDILTYAIPTTAIASIAYVFAAFVAHATTYSPAAPATTTPPVTAQESEPTVDQLLEESLALGIELDIEGIAAYSEIAGEAEAHGEDPAPIYVAQEKALKKELEDEIKLAKKRTASRKKATISDMLRSEVKAK